ncbi:MAG: tRNA (guanosine(46)-N7)-methyltransferase TrmB [Spirochaetaceae bacterium]|nr:tRNA (guanosine(46)-N7)-methyltransferase TrmB [Spirochaetaceae bacterium]
MTRAQKAAYYGAADCVYQHFADDAPPARPLDFAALFGNKNPVIVEIGFGDGRAAAAFARENPALNILGIEVFKAGIGRLLWEIEQQRLPNVRIIEGDAAAIVSQMLPAASVAGFHILFPDPWPKKRHHKRRLIRRPFTGNLAAALMPGAYIYFASDWEEYAASALQELSQTAGLENTCPAFANAPLARIQTKFEKKAIAAGRTVRELFFRRAPILL